MASNEPAAVPIRIWMYRVACELESCGLPPPQGTLALVGWATEWGTLLPSPMEWTGLPNEEAAAARGAAVAAATLSLHPRRELHPPARNILTGIGGMTESGKVDTFPTVGDPLPEGEGAAPLGRVLPADSAAVPQVAPIARQVERVSYELQLMYSAQGTCAFKALTVNTTGVIRTIIG